MNPVVFSSKKHDYETPAYVFDYCSQRYGPFDLDVAASPSNAKCKEFFSLELGKNAFFQGWNGANCWMNPPYGRALKEWMKEAHDRHGAWVTCLVPARTDTAWFHDYVKDADEVLFLRRRVKFVGMKTGAPFPSMIVHFGRRDSTKPSFELVTL